VSNTAANALWGHLLPWQGGVFDPLRKKMKTRVVSVAPSQVRLSIDAKPKNGLGKERGAMFKR
jgi:hypothetical protein